MNGSASDCSQVSQIPPVDVDDALQYTPLSSIVPFAPDMIILPTHSVATKSIYQSDAERFASKQALQLLDRHTEANAESRLVQKYYQDITSQIDAAEATEYRFKALVAGGGRNAGSGRVAVEIVRNSGGGRFAEMVVGRRSHSYNNNSSTSFHDAAQLSVTPLRPAPQLTPSRTVLSVDTQSHDRHQEHARERSSMSIDPLASPANGYRRQSFQIQIPVHTPTMRNKSATVSISPTPGSSQKLEAVVIKASPRIDRSQYVKLDRTMKKSKPLGSGFSNIRKRKRAHSDVEDEPLNAGVDQRARADNLLTNLQNLIESIFQAEDNIEPDTSGNRVSGSEAAKYWLSATENTDYPCLSNAIQIKLENSIKKVVDVKRFSRIPVEDITRLEKLCENALRDPTIQSIVPPLDDSESDMENWLRRISSIDNSLKTAKTVLRVMLGGREEKQIYSEDLLANVLLLVKELIANALNPMIEMRSSGEQLDTFRAAFAQKRVLGGLLHEVTNVITLFSHIVANEEATESAVTSALYMAASIVFIENASNEKDSVFGLQRVEMFRLAAMDILTKIFARYHDQRATIFEQILQNLEKLPVNRATARQFKLVEGGKNIQLVSALIMRLIQTSGTYQRKRKRGKLVSGEGDGDVYERSDEDSQPESNADTAITKLNSICSPLLDSAIKNSNSIIQYLVSKAMTSTKSGDQPYRHLLDIFTEDFLTVLGSPEWPGAEILLRCLVLSMCAIVDQDKQSVTAKTMALDMLGLMGSGICDLVVHLRESHRNREGGSNSIDAHIARLTDRYLDIGSGSAGRTALAMLEIDLYDWGGLSRVALEYLFDARSRDSTLQSACGYFLTWWSHKVCNVYERIGDEDDDIAADLARCAMDLRKITLDREWDDDFDIADVSPSQIRQAYALMVLSMPFCASFEVLFNRLLRSVDDNQAQSRSKSLKSIMQLLAKDPNIVNRTQVIPYIVKKAEDASSLVRDSAVDLLGKCIAIKPELEELACTTIVARAADTGVAVRKRSMKILKDIYLNTKKEYLKVQIAEALIQRIKDIDNGVSEQAKKTFEEIWIAPFYSLIGEPSDGDGSHFDISPRMKLVANERVSVIVKVVQKESTLAALHEVIRSLLQQDNNKNSDRNFRVCKTMVSSMFDDLLNRQGDSDRADRENTMQTLTVFAKANAKLFTPEQLILLQPYIENLTSDDLQLFRSVIIIYRYALSILTTRQSKFLSDVQVSLLKNLSRLPPQELDEVVSCLRTISKILNAPERLIRVTVSCITNILKSKGKEVTDQQEVKKLVRTLHIVGLFGHYCDFEDRVATYKGHFPQWKGDSVSGLMAETMIPFCSRTADPSIRLAAIEGLGHICQTHAVHFLKPQVIEILNQVFKEQDSTLTSHVMTGLRGFFRIEESRSESAAAEDGGPKDKKTKKPEEPGRLAQAAYAGQNDGVSTTLAQTYLKDFIRIATSTQDAHALVAVEVMASILRQGLVHPKELVPALLALETSTNSAISQIAYKEHKALHSKYESLVERGYMEGVRACFLYQHDVACDPAGATVDPFVAKLQPLYDVVKEGTRKIKKKLLSNLISTLDFELSTLGVEQQPSHLDYAKFVVENLTFLDYATVDEVYQVVTGLEKLVTGTGVMVAHSIETDVFFIKLDNEQEKEDKVIDPGRLKLLSSGATILMMLWAARTFLRKSHGLNDHKCREYRHGKVKANDPTLSKAPGRNPNVNPNTVWEQINGAAGGQVTASDMVDQCRQFLEILTVDSEYKLVAEDEDGDDLDVDEGFGNTPEKSDDEAPASHTPKNRKRKGSAEAGERTAKRRKPSTKRKRSKDRGG